MTYLDPVKKLVEESDGLTPAAFEHAVKSRSLLPLLLEVAEAGEGLMQGPPRGNSKRRQALQQALEALRHHLQEEGK